MDKASYILAKTYEGPFWYPSSLFYFLVWRSGSQIGFLGSRPLGTLFYFSYLNLQYPKEDRYEKSPFPYLLTPLILRAVCSYSGWRHQCIIMGRSWLCEGSEATTWLRAERKSQVDPTIQTPVRAKHATTNWYWSMEGSAWRKNMAVTPATHESRDLTHRLKRLCTV